jgi:glycine/D-amino acid oxidase-like deaminating enzyme
MSKRFWHFSANRVIAPRLNGCWMRPSQISRNSPRGIIQTRFSDGSLRVFYSSLELETAESEVLHGYAAAALGQSPRVAYYNRLRCCFRGSALDLRPLAGGWPFLTADGAEAYSLCHALAREGVELGVDGFFTPSARRPSGTNVPVFRRGALAELEILGVTALSQDSDANEVTVRNR